MNFYWNPNKYQMKKKVFLLLPKKKERRRKKIPNEIKYEGIGKTHSYYFQ